MAQAKFLALPPGLRSRPLIKFGTDTCVHFTRFLGGACTGPRAVVPRRQLPGALRPEFSPPGLCVRGRTPTMYGCGTAGGTGQPASTPGVCVHAPAVEQAPCLPGGTHFKASQSHRCGSIPYPRFRPRQATVGNRVGQQRKTTAGAHPRAAGQYPGAVPHRARGGVGPPTGSPPRLFSRRSRKALKPAPCERPPRR